MRVKRGRPSANTAVSGPEPLNIRGGGILLLQPGGPGTFQNEELRA